MLNKTGKPFRISMGLPISWERLDVDATRATYALRAFTERVLASQPDAEFA